MRNLAFAFAACLLLAACPNGHEQPDAALPDADVPDARLPDGDLPDARLPDAGPPDAGPTRDIDILFVVDNSGSMGEEQTSLTNNFPQFMAVLNAIEGGLPNVHIGVVSSNVGVGGYNITGCGGDGDDGALQNTPRISGCTPPDGAFISDVEMADGSRAKNYSGELASTFSCIAALGTSGCGFEQHLESMKRALDGHREGNAGFLRDDAYLAVIIIADEDDCSARDSTMYDPNDTALTGTLGPLASFRCTEFGITCDEGNVGRASGSYTGCRPRQDSPYLRDPQDFVNFLKSLKSDPSRIIVSGIIGNSEPVRVKLNERGEPQLDHSCVDPSGFNGAADPGVRLKYVLDQFPGRSSVTSICNNDLSAALQHIAELLARVVGH
jgi:hypothetical protein